MTEEKRIEELEALNRRLLEANTSLQKNQARIDRLLFEIRYRSFLFMAVLLGIILLVSLYPLARSYSENVFNPTNVPGDYEIVNKYVSKNAGDTTKVFWLPAFRQGFKYTWAPEKRIGPFNSLSSNPSIGNIHDPFRPDSYINWLEKYWRPFFPSVSLSTSAMGVRQDVGSRLLIPLAPRYVISDSSVPGNDFTAPLSADKSFKSVFKSGKLEVFEVNNYQGDVWPANITLRVHDYWDHLAIIQKMGPENMAGIAFADDKDQNAQGYPQLDMRSHESDNLVANGDFEEGYGYVPFLNWTPSNNNGANYNWSRDSKTKVSGSYSMLVENRSKEQYKIGWVVSDHIDVQPDSVYTFNSNIRTRNSTWTNVMIEGYQSKTRQWVQVAKCPDIQGQDQDWKEYHISFYLPAGINKIRLLLGAGWVKDDARGPGRTWFDNMRLRKVNDEFFYKILEQKRRPGVQVSYKKLGPARYKVHVENPNKGVPFLLVLGEAFDPWVAKLPDGRTVQSTSLFSTVCGFPINMAGSFDVTIEYPPENWLVRGFILSSLALLLCFVYLLVVLNRRNGAINNIEAAVADTGRHVRKRSHETVKIASDEQVGKRRMRDMRNRVRRTYEKIRESIEGPPRR